MKKTGLPATGIIEIHFDETSFKLLANRVMNSLVVEACIIKDDNVKAKITVKITDVFSPDMLEWKITTILNRSNIETGLAQGVTRADAKVHEYLQKKYWYLFGKTNDAAQRDICIVVLPGIVSGYSFKKDGESDSDFRARLN